MTSDDHMARIKQLEHEYQMKVHELERLFAAQRMSASQIASFDAKSQQLLQSTSMLKANSLQQRQQEAKQEAKLEELTKAMTGILGGHPLPQDKTIIGSLLSMAPTVLGIGGTMLAGYQGAKHYQELRRHPTVQPCPVVFTCSFEELHEIYSNKKTIKKNWHKISLIYAPHDDSICFNGISFEKYKSKEKISNINAFTTLVFVDSTDESMWLPDPLTPHGEFTWFATLKAPPSSRGFFR